MITTLREESSRQIDGEVGMPLQREITLDQLKYVENLRIDINMLIRSDWKLCITRSGKGAHFLWSHRFQHSSLVYHRTQ
jgi:hypothetical protein